MKEKPKVEELSRIRAKLEVLLRAIDENIAFNFSSPIAPYLELIMDLSLGLSHFANFKRFYNRINPELIFVEDREVETGRFIHRDSPEGNGVEEGLFDNLGNPLQIKVEFQDPLKSLSYKDKVLIGNFFKEISEFIAMLRRGIVDWRVMRRVTRKLRDYNKIPKPTSHENYFYHRRHHNRNKSN